MLKRAALLVLSLLMIGGSLIGFGLWRSEKIAYVTRLQIEHYYQLYNRQASRAIYNTMTSTRLRKVTTLQQFEKVWRFKFHTQGPHQEILKARSMLTIHLNPNFTIFQVMYHHRHQRAEVRELVTWVHEDDGWKIDSIKP